MPPKADNRSRPDSDGETPSVAPPPKIKVITTLTPLDGGSDLDALGETVVNPIMSDSVEPDSPAFASPASSVSWGSPPQPGTPAQSAELNEPSGGEEETAFTPLEVTVFETVVIEERMVCVNSAPHVKEPPTIQRQATVPSVTSGPDGPLVNYDSSASSLVECTPEEVAFECNAWGYDPDRCTSDESPTIVDVSSSRQEQAAPLPEAAPIHHLALLPAVPVPPGSRLGESGPTVSSSDDTDSFGVALDHLIDQYGAPASDSSSAEGESTSQH